MLNRVTKCTNFDLNWVAVLWPRRHTSTQTSLSGRLLRVSARNSVVVLLTLLFFGKKTNKPVMKLATGDSGNSK